MSSSSNIKSKALARPMKGMLVSSVGGFPPGLVLVAGVFVRFGGGGSDCCWVLLFLFTTGMDVSTARPDRSSLDGDGGGESSAESGEVSSFWETGDPFVLTCNILRTWKSVNSDPEASRIR